MNIITVLKSSPTWTPEYVIKLKKAVDKNLKIDHNFYCITDVSEISDMSKGSIENGVSIIVYIYIYTYLNQYKYNFNFF